MPASAYGRLPLNALRVFEAVATRLSFAEAAEALNVTPAAVSQQIKALEEYLQIPVLRRSGRKVELTPECAKLLPGVQSGLDALVVTLRETRMMRAGGVLNVSTLSSLMQKWMTPRLHRLHAKFPDLQVDWHTSREAVDFSRSDFHAAVRLGENIAPGLDFEHLMDEWLVVIASPQLYKKHGSIDERATLKGIPMLQAKDEPWSRFEKSAAPTPWPAGPTIIDDSVSVLSAVLEGLGYAPAGHPVSEPIEHHAPPGGTSFVRRIPNGGAVDAVRDGITGLLCNAADADDVYTQTLKLLADQGASRSFGHAAQVRARGEAQWSSAVQTYLTALQ